MLFLRCCILGVMRQQFGLRLINWASHPQLCCRCRCALPGVASLASSRRVSGWIKFLRYTSPTRCILSTDGAIIIARTPTAWDVNYADVMYVIAFVTRQDMGTLAVFEVVESKTEGKHSKSVALVLFAVYPFEFWRLLTTIYFLMTYVVCHFAEKKERERESIMHTLLYTFFRHGEKSHREWSLYKVAGI